MRLGKEAIWWLESLKDSGLPGTRIHPDNLALRERVRVDFMATTIFRSMGRVIIERDHFAILLLGHESCMVLETELDIGSKIKVEFDSSQAPDNISGSAIDLVHSTGISSGDQIIPLGVLVDGIDMEIIPGVRGVVSRADLARVDGQDHLWMWMLGVGSATSIFRMDLTHHQETHVLS